MKVLGAVILALVVAYTVFSWANSGPAVRYRLTATIESGGVAHTGSGIIQVRTKFQEYWSPSVVQYVTGDAVVVDVPGRLPVFFLLKSETNSEWATSIPYTMFEDKLPMREGSRAIVRALAALREVRVIPRDRYPLIVSFRDLSRPETVYEIFLNDMSPPLDADARVSALTIEMTGESATKGILEAKLAWISNFSGRLDGAKLHRYGKSFANSLSRRDFERR